MAIWLHFINVLVPITTIEKKLKIDFDEFFEKYDKGIKFHDKHLFATGAMGAEPKGFTVFGDPTSNQSERSR